MLNVAVFKPSGTVMDDGTLAAVSSLSRSTFSPPKGALPERVIVAFAVDSELTTGGLIRILAVGGRRSSWADLVCVPKVAVMFVCV